MRTYLCGGGGTDPAQVGQFWGETVTMILFGKWEPQISIVLDPNTYCKWVRLHCTAEFANCPGRQYAVISIWQP